MSLPFGVVLLMWFILNSRRFLFIEQTGSIQCFELYKNLQGLRFGKEHFGNGTGTFYGLNVV
jgi:hypothetical protein